MSMSTHIKQVITFHFIHCFFRYEYTFLALSVAVTLFALLFSGTDNNCSAFKTLKMSNLTSLSIPVHICLMQQCKYDMNRLNVIFYLVNNVVPWLTSCKNEQPIENLSSLLDQLLPASMIVSFTLQTSNLHNQTNNAVLQIVMFYLLEIMYHATQMVRQNNTMRSQVRGM